MLDRDQLRNQANPMQAIFLLFVILILVSIGIYQTVPHKPSSLSSPESAFSSARAILHVRQIGSKPHPTGSPENAEVRQYLINQLTALGLTPEIQSTFASNSRKKQSGYMHSVLVKIPGAKSGKALLLAAHYDSVPEGPGAADNAASVAAILETLRAIKTYPPLQNDLICLFTDSEEAGLLGAQAFVEQHHWAKEVGLALNFEYRGNSGAFMMFETSEGNGLVIAGLATAVPFVMATSLMYEVYKRLPNDTDFSVFKRAGISGMNFAAIEGHKHYHTALDRPEFLNESTLQHEGDIMLALVKHFGNQPLDDLKAEDRQYFDFPGIGIIHYPMWWTIPLCGLLAILFVTLCVIDYKTKAVRLIPTVIAMCAYLMLVYGLYLINGTLWTGLQLFHPDYDAFAYYDTFISYCYFLGFILINIIFVAVFYWVVRRWLKPMELNLGVAAIWLALALLTIKNGANFLFYWPLLAVLISLSLIKLPAIKNHPSLNSLVLLAGSVPGLLIFSPLIKNLFIGLTPSFMAIILIFLSLLLGLMFPLLTAIGSNRTDIAKPQE
jgi:Peptidase family M28